LLDGLAMYLSCDTKKFHDNESTHILHNFWTSTHRGKLPPSPLAAPLPHESTPQTVKMSVIGSSVFAGFTVMIDTDTDSQTTLYLYNIFSHAMSAMWPNNAVAAVL